MTKTRQSAVASAFYPKTENEIKKMLTVFFKNAKKDKEFEKLTEKLAGKIIHGIIVPHAGWIYSGGVAGYAYELIKDSLKNRVYKKIVMLGPNHTVYTDKAVIDDNDAWETPLGSVKVMKTNIKDDDFVYSSTPHQNEHDLEVQVPFLQFIYKKPDNKNSICKDSEFEILPIIIGNLSMKELESIADNLLENYNDEETLFLISTDLSHYQPQETAEKLDKNTIKIIETLDVEKAGKMDACGRNPLIVAMFLCKKLGVTPITLKYATSGDVSGDYNAVVGYVSMVF